MTILNGKLLGHLEDPATVSKFVALIKEGRALIKSLNTSVRRFFRANSEILAEWRAASRIRHTGGSSDAEEITSPTGTTALV